jgi:type IV secretion system protein VirB6
MKVGESKTLKELDPTNPIFGTVKQAQNITLTAVILDNSVCLTMPTSRGPIPLICKTVANPVPIIDPADSTCKNIGNSCYDGQSKSQSLFNFSGKAIHCVKETLNKVFYEPITCNKDKVNTDSLNPFSVFQESLKVSIRAAFIIYVILYGFKVVMNNEYLHLEKVSMFVIKLILVSYFSVGLGPLYYNKESKLVSNNGMLEQGLPLLLQMTSDFAQIVFNAGGSKGLCEFDLSKYERGYEFYAIWDSIDCRMGHYLGMSFVNNTATLLKSATSSTSKATGNAINIPDFGNAFVEDLKIPNGLPFFMVLFGFLMAGNIIIVISGIAFAIIFISINLYFITSYLVCLITLCVMTYISPIFIPMVLFERTKAYFDSWLRITISCALQPAMIAGFIALLLSMYDVAIYKNCEFQHHDYEILGTSFTTFELRTPDVDAAKCESSLGYKLLRLYAGEGWEKGSFILFTIYSIRDIALVIYEFLYVFIFSCLFYFFSKSISQFAADITNGPLMDSVVASPTKVVELAGKAAKFMKDAAETANSGGAKPKSSEDTKPRKGGEGAGGDKGAEDKMSGGGDKGAGDKMSGGGSGAADKISGGK